MDKPLAFIDLETTGLDIAKDRIIQVGVLKVYGAPKSVGPEGIVFAEGESHTFSVLVNPQRAVPQEVLALTGLTQEALDLAEPFANIAQRLSDYLKGCDLVGFNIHGFDLPVLVEEFLRCEVDWEPSGLVLDAGIIFKKKEERTLSAALEFYCGRKHEKAHEALNDAVATSAVFFGQLRKYEDLGRMPLAELAQFARFEERVDFAGKLSRDKDGDVVYNIGQRTKGVKVKDDIGMAYWMLERDFPLDTKRKLQRVLDDLAKENAAARAAHAEKNDGMPF